MVRTMALPRNDLAENGPQLTVQIATKDRAVPLRRCLDSIAAVRYRIWGRADACQLVSPEQRSRYLPPILRGGPVPTKFIMEGRADVARVDKQFRHCVDRHATHAGDRTHRGPLAKHGEDLDAGFGIKLVHTISI